MQWNNYSALDVLSVARDQKDARIELGLAFERERRRRILVRKADLDGEANTDAGRSRSLGDC